MGILSLCSLDPNTDSFAISPFIHTKRVKGPFTKGKGAVRQAEYVQSYENIQQLDYEPEFFYEQIVKEAHCS